MTTPDYHAAAREARALADATGREVSIRAHREYGKLVYTVRYVSPTDSDYWTTEIVKPSKQSTQGVRS